MSAVIRGAVLKPNAKKKRNKGNKALRSLRRALARRKLEQIRDDELLKEQIYDVFEDCDESS